MVAAGRRALPFGAGEDVEIPADDKSAIRCLDKLRQSGANFLAFAWPAFWWLDYYPEFQAYIRSEFRCVLQNDRLVIFDLRGSPESDPGISRQDD
jgi:hypothetical protein